MPRKIDYRDDYDLQVAVVKDNIQFIENTLRQMGQNRSPQKVMEDTFAYYRLWKKALQILLQTKRQFRNDSWPKDLDPIFEKRNLPPLLRSPYERRRVDGTIEYLHTEPDPRIQAEIERMLHPEKYKSRTNHLTKKPKR